MSAEAYFLYHSIGQYPGKAEAMAAALAEFAAQWSDAGDGHWGYALGIRQRFIERWRALIVAAEGTLTTTENVTSGLASLIGALPTEHLKGRRVLIAGDCFPSLHFLLTGLGPRLGFTLDTVPLRPGATWVEDEDVIARWGADVGVALLTWVSSTSSHRCDLQTLTAHGRAMGSLAGVDITQAVGLLPFDVSNPAVDFTLSTSLKWLCGTPGAGILHVAEPLIAACQPELRGWFSQENIFSWDLDKFALARDIRRFDHGTPSIVAAAGSLPALEWHAAQDHSEQRARNLAQCHSIIEAAEALGFAFASPRGDNARGGSVMLRMPPELPAARVLKHLGERRIFADARGQTLRLSPGFVTTDDGVARLIAALGEIARA